jgi:ABC-type Fe3+-hydroxamate transport system substrate-binding protein
MGNTIQLTLPPKRIVSLVPSQTELLYSLGLNEEVVGITKFCIHPNQWFRTKKRIGGTKTVLIDAVQSLQPDLIIANKEENVQAQIEALQGLAPVWVSDIHTMADALQMIRSVGELVERQNEANKIADDIREGFQQIQVLKTKVPTAYLIWKDPYMAAGGDTFINDILEYCGFDNVLKAYQRYPKTTIAQLSELNCRLLLLSSEPYPFAEKHVQQLQQQLPGTKIILTDGEMYSWYGSRLVLTPGYLQQLINQVQQ